MSMTIRMGWAALFALVLALRLLTPAGFMPAFDHGAMTIVPCPDADGAPIITTHHHGHGKTPQHFHQPCPYVAGSAPGLAGADFVALGALLVVAAVLLLGRRFFFLGSRAHDRPPLRGPPLPA
jgi:hypothetical protein